MLISKVQDFGNFELSSMQNEHEASKIRVLAVHLNGYLKGVKKVCSALHHRISNHLKRL